MSEPLDHHREQVARQQHQQPCDEAGLVGKPVGLAAGISDTCFANGIDREKERCEAAERNRRYVLAEAARTFLGPEATQ